MFDAESDLFARIVIFPTHFSLRAGVEFLTFNCIVPRPRLDKDGISIIKCSEIKFGNLIKQGELIVNSQKKREKILELEFYGCVFMLRDSICENFELFQKGKDKSHFLMKYKNVDYDKPFPYSDTELMKNHNLLLQDSVIVKREEMIEINSKNNVWDIICDKFSI